MTAAACLRCRRRTTDSRSGRDRRGPRVAGGACCVSSPGRLKQALPGEAFQQLGQRRGVELVEVVAGLHDDAHDGERPGLPTELGGETVDHCRDGGVDPRGDGCSSSVFAQRARSSDVVGCAGHVQAEPASTANGLCRPAIHGIAEGRGGGAAGVVVGQPVSGRTPPRSGPTPARDTRPAPSRARGGGMSRPTRSPRGEGYGWVRVRVRAPAGEQPVSASPTASARGVVVGVGHRQCT
jgi:hypothetical protein